MADKAKNYDEYEFSARIEARKRTSPYGSEPTVEVERKQTFVLAAGDDWRMREQLDDFIQDVRGTAIQAVRIRQEFEGAMRALEAGDTDDTVEGAEV